jgi:hypothetical protein
MRRLTLLALVSRSRRFASSRRSASAQVISINAHPSSFLGATMIPTTRLVSSDINLKRTFFIGCIFFPRITSRLAGERLHRKTCSHCAQIDESREHLRLLIRVFTRSIGPMGLDRAPPRALRRHGRAEAPCIASNGARCRIICLFTYGIVRPIVQRFTVC